MFDITQYVTELSLGAVVLLWVFSEIVKGRTASKSAKNLNENETQVLQFQNSLLQRVSDVEAQLKVALQEISDLKDSNVKVIAENERLKARLLVMETAHFDLPMPMWLKDTHGVMLSLNKSYEREFLKPLGITETDYIGNTDYDVWDKEIAKEFIHNDRHVALTDRVWIGAEHVPTKEGIRRFGIIKYPRRESGKVIGIAGIAVPSEMLDALGLDEAVD